MDLISLAFLILFWGAVIWALIHRTKKKLLSDARTKTLPRTVTSHPRDESKPHDGFHVMFADCGFERLPESLGSSIGAAEQKN